MWYEIKNHAKNVELGDFIVMPNHVHGIIILNMNAPVETRHALSDEEVETRHALSQKRPNDDSSVETRHALCHGL
ncbi:MAG TPA: hypothetical protein VN726_03815 [Hanamia sp.]|nr:hypothetical protein [Hanamia sp.]